MESMSKLIKEIDILLTYEQVLKGHDPDVNALCCKVNDEIQLIKKGIEDLRKQLSEQREQISHCKELSRTIENIESKVKYISNNLPDKYLYDNNENELPVYKVVETPGMPSPIGAMGRDLSPDSAEACAFSARLKTNHSKIMYLKCEEFDKIPRYMRGRLNYETINKFVDEFNVALQKKYDLFGRPREMLRGKMLIAYDKFKRQETSETIEKCIYFCTAEDLKTYSDIKMDKASIKLLDILRQAKRIREIRSPGLVRYAVV